MLKYFALITTVGGLSLHLMGHVAHRVLLTRLGADPSLFPKSTDWLVINGYYTLADRFMLFLRAYTDHAGWLTLIILATTAYMFVVDRAGRYLRRKGPPDLGWLPAWARDVARNLFGTLMAFVAFPVAIIACFLLILVPAVLGETAGNDVAAKQLERFAKGCPQPAACAQLVRDGNTIANGYIVDASQSHIAIYDVTHGRVRTIATDGIEVIGTKPATVDQRAPAAAPQASQSTGQSGGAPAE